MIAVALGWICSSWLSSLAASFALTMSPESPLLIDERVLVTATVVAVVAWGLVSLVPLVAVNTYPATLTPQGGARSCHTGRFGPVLTVAQITIALVLVSASV